MAKENERNIINACRLDLRSILTSTANRERAPLLLYTRKTKARYELSLCLSYFLIPGKFL